MGASGKFEADELELMEEPDFEESEVILHLFRTPPPSFPHLWRSWILGACHSVCCWDNKSKF